VDLHLGIESGQELIQFIRTQEDYRQIPIVAISGFQDLDAGYETAANLFLVKPTDMRGWTDIVIRLQEYFPSS
jgi:CheY-like chemotaxis protein